MRLLAAVVVCVTLGVTPLHAQTHHGAAKATGAGPRGSAPVVTPTAPKVAPPKPEAPKVEPARPEVAKVEVTKLPQAKAPAAKAAPPVPRSLEETGAAIAAALAARAGAPKPPRVNGVGLPSASAAPRYRGPRYLLRWPEIHWDIQWPVPSDRVALEWPDAPASN